ncbi:hemin uptake protein HemP [Taklimakanibacter lacteus]|uniref:hemin uptake protein HemP n=1 Tax=Taklimakanibacter lacteus TaxID=2268456 RepID=UPI000E663FE2
MINQAPNNELAPQKTPAPYEGETASGGEATYSSRDLFRDKTEIRIEHQGEMYRLRITRSGGLLLNK